MKYFVRGSIPNVKPLSPIRVGPVVLRSETFEYQSECVGDWKGDAERIELSMRATLGLLWRLWTAPRRTSVRQGTPNGPSLEEHLMMTTNVVDHLTAETMVAPDLCFSAVGSADADLVKLLSLYLDALGTEGPGNGEHFRAWAFALVIDAWGGGEGPWRQRCDALVEQLNSVGYEVPISGKDLAAIRHKALKYRNWRTATLDPEELNQLGHVARGYLLMRLGLLDPQPSR